MPSAIKKCRVCGKEYETCRSVNRNAGVFRWQEVACSPECGAIYLQRIEESRGHIPPTSECHKNLVEDFKNDTIAVVIDDEQAVESEQGIDPEVIE